MIVSTSPFRPPLDSSFDAIDRRLGPWRRRIRLVHSVRWAIRGLAAGLLLAISSLLVARLIPWEVATSVAAAAIALGMAGGLLGAWLTPLPLSRLAQIVDQAADLADRTRTALELRNLDAPLALLQRTDTLARLGSADCRLLTPRPARRETMAVLVLSVITVIALLVPNPMQAILSRQRAERHRIASAQQQVERLARSTVDLSAPPETRAATERALQELARQLGQARDIPSALAAVSRTEQAVRSTGPAHGEQATGALAAEAKALWRAAPTRRLAGALTRRDAAALARETAALQAALARLTPEERVAVARALQEAANANESAGADPAAASLTTSLRAAAQAVQQADLTEAAAQLGSAQSGLSAQIDASQTVAAVAQTIAGLEQARRTIVSDSRSPSEAGSNGHASASAQTGAGRASRAGSSASPGGSPGAPAAVAGAPGRGMGSTTGSSDTLGRDRGGHAASGGRITARPGGSTPGDQVYLPGQNGPGPSDELNGASGPAIGVEVPYQQVIGQYAASAREHLDHSALPPELRGLVREYFLRLEETGGQ